MGKLEDEILGAPEEWAESAARLIKAEKNSQALYRLQILGMEFEEAYRLIVEMEGDPQEAVKLREAGKSLKEMEQELFKKP